MKFPWLYALLVAYVATPVWAQDDASPQTGGNSMPADAQVLRLDDVVREALEKSPEAEGLCTQSRRCSIALLRPKLCPIPWLQWDGRAIQRPSASWRTMRRAIVA